MKKYVFKATALAIGALVGGSAFAALDLTAVAPAPQTTNTYANEFDYSAAAGEIAAGQTIKSILGFGVSSGQNRYIRVDLSGVKIGTIGAGVTATSVTGFDSATVVAGGAAGDSYVIIQVTGLTGTGNAATDVVTITLPALRTTAGNVAPTATYALYETAVAAVAAAPNTQLATPKTGTLFNFAAGLAFTPTVGTNKALVAKSFKEFEASAAPTTAVLATLGSFSYGIATDSNGSAVLKNSGALTVADLVTAASKVTIAGDFTAAAAVADVYLVTGVGTCAVPGAPGKLGTLNAGKTSLSYSLPAAAGTFTLCYAVPGAGVAGAKAIPAQTITADYAPVAQSGATVADPAAKAVAQITRDGATLQAPFVTTHPDYLSRVILNSTYASDASVELSVITKDGVTCSNSVYKTTLPAGKQIMVNVKDICGDITAGTTFFAVQAIVAATADTIQGAYNAVQYDVTTGKPGAYMSYPLVAPVK